MRKNLSRLAVVAVTTGSLMTLAGTASAAELARVTNPANGCTYVLYGPTISVTTFPPAVGSTGGTGAGVFCP